MNLLTCSSALATLSPSTTTAITTTTSSSSSSLSSTLSSISSSSSTGKELHPTTTIWPEHGQWNCTGKLNVALGLGPFDNLFDALIAKGHTSHPNGFNHRLANNYDQLIDLKRDEQQQQQQQPLAFGNYCNSAMVDNEMDYGYYSYNYPCGGAANGYNYIDHDNNTSSINKQNNQSPINFNSVDASSMQFSDQFYFGYNSTYSHSPINQLNFVDDINKYNNNNNGNYLSADYLTYTNFYYQ